MTDPDKFYVKLPPTIFLTYIHWYEGRCLRSMLSKSTFYRHRKILLQHGVDISLVVQTVSPPPPPPVRYITATPVDEAEREALFWSLVK